MSSKPMSSSPGHSGDRRDAESGRPSHSTREELRNMSYGIQVESEDDDTLIDPALLRPFMELSSDSDEASSDVSDLFEDNYSEQAPPSAEKKMQMPPDARRRLEYELARHSVEVERIELENYVPATGNNSCATLVCSP